MLVACKGNTLLSTIYLTPWGIDIGLLPASDANYIHLWG